MPHRIGFLVFDGVTMLDVAGPSEVFNQADPGRQHYELVHIAPTRGWVTTSVGMTLDATVLPEEAGELDTLIIAGSDILLDEPIEAGLLDAVRGLVANTARVASICIGVFLLAELGMLDGRRATTHWRQTELLRSRHPRVLVEPDIVHMQDGPYWTCAGRTAGIDLTLAMVEADLGVDSARETARELVMFTRRPGGQSQFSAAVRPPLTPGSSLRTTLDAVRQNPAADHTVVSMAAAAGFSERHLNRMFHTELSTTPSHWLEQARLQAAQAMVLAGHTVTRTAQASGFGSDETLRRAFVRQFGISPTEYRDRYSITAALTLP